MDQEGPIQSDRPRRGRLPDAIQRDAIRGSGANKFSRHGALQKNYRKEHKGHKEDIKNKNSNNLFRVPSL
jgi:hypothetical protein